MKKTVDVEIDISPEDAVMAFSYGGNDWQARFFNMLAEDVEHGYANGATGFERQMQYVANTCELTPGARWIMAIIGDAADSDGPARHTLAGPDLAAAARFASAEDDDGEACLDDAGSSHDGDETYSTEIDGLPWRTSEPDARCARCSESDDLATIIHGHEEMMLAYADRLAVDDPVWALMRQQYQALLSRI